MGKVDLGDFQTPKHLTDAICEYLAKEGLKPDVLIEPTCGSGNFVISALKYFPSLRYVYCVEIQPKYEDEFHHNMASINLEYKAKIEFHNDNIFTHKFSDDFLNVLKDNPYILILGNPPWVTNAEISRLGGDNIPPKMNIKRYKGIDALTGKSNFDISEYIILHMIKQFCEWKGTIAMLCKTSVAKNIIQSAPLFNLKIRNAKLLLIDAKKEFNVNASAGLFIADFGYEVTTTCKVSSFYCPSKETRKFGWYNSKFVSDIELYKRYGFLDGVSPFEWRQGVKHDASKILILKKTQDGLINGLGEKVEIEEEFLYPFVRGSKLRASEVKDTANMIILTQKRLGDNTSILKEYPKLWDYLTSHAKYLDGRKSRVYKDRFSIFGIGPYVFKPYKVAICGLYKEPNFSLIYPINGKPAILDDTSYYLSFDSLEEAVQVWKMLNSDCVKKFMLANAFLDSKRPFTKELLNRIDLSKLQILVGENEDIPELLKRQTTPSSS
ncbi:MAG: methyltransferase [Archaeoglobales archaeon]|nr:MAG: methyltransferase [Archaeoglobales archaeon]